MATIQALEGRTVHQIQSGQVIVDLCSVVKELVENSLDAGATSVEVRFKNHGLDTIEVQDNGSGISTENYETIALKHHTSKLSVLDDLTSLQTFGFRGEALSSLCALSDFHIVTARQNEAPKGTRLDFELSGKLSKTSVIASPKGSTIAVANLFSKLPVRRRELEKHIKREYGKVLALLQAYACISAEVKFIVSNEMAKGRKLAVFSTNSNRSTRDNIANVYGAKTLANLLDMDIDLAMEPTSTALKREGPQAAKFRLVGHVSRPTFGEGRQTPDRQMFFVNSRPCNLPQLARVFNEVYKSFNVAQSPFVFANIQLDTNAYDVNVSPDKRTILLHDQSALLEAVRKSLLELFENQEQILPQSQHPSNRLPSFKPLIVHSQRSSSDLDADFESPSQTPSQDVERRPGPAKQGSGVDQEASTSHTSLIEKFASRGTVERAHLPRPKSATEDNSDNVSRIKKRTIHNLARKVNEAEQVDEAENARSSAKFGAIKNGTERQVEDFNSRLAEQDNTTQSHSDPKTDIDREQAPRGVEMSQAVPPTSSVVQNAFDRMRPSRTSPEIATVTIGSKTTTSILGSSIHSQRKGNAVPSTNDNSQPYITEHASQSSTGMQRFAAPGSAPIVTAGPTKSKARPADIQQQQYDLSDVESNQTSSEFEAEKDPDELSRAIDDSENEDGTNEQSDSDPEYVDEDEKKAREEARVEELIRQAEEAAAIPSEACIRRATSALKGSAARDSTLNFIQTLDASLTSIRNQLQELTSSSVSRDEQDDASPKLAAQHPLDPGIEEPETDRVTLTVTKQDFSSLRIIGQFNLGFILASREDKDLFIIDQHASDEKINFERLQATTIMQSQRLVNPHRLELTAVDEEIIMENQDAFLRNGFLVEVDERGDYPVGQRVSLVSLPMSKETTFTPADLEELIVLLGDTPDSSSRSTVPRPSRTRKLFAMRACRSSIMIGKVLTKPMMTRLVSKMGEIDKPWNCPHGRPTMRHVCRLDSLFDESSHESQDGEDDIIDWGSWMEKIESQGQPDLQQTSEGPGPYDSREISGSTSEVESL